jgi:hypothetical protein
MAATACSGGSPSPTVAHLGSTSATTAPPSNSGGPSSGPDLAKATAFSACMRKHGLPDFPDPKVGSNGGVGIEITGHAGGGPGVMDPNSATFKAAQEACKSLLPNGGVAPKMTAADQQKFLQWAACIRSHGVPDFPDPQFGDGGARISIGGGPGKGPDPNSPTFKAAQDACKSLMPGKGGPGTLSTDHSG